MVAVGNQESGKKYSPLWTIHGTHIMYLVAQNMVRTFWKNKVFRFVEGNLLHQKSREIRNVFRKRPVLLLTCATYYELPYYVSPMLLHSTIKFTKDFQIPLNWVHSICMQKTIYIFAPILDKHAVMILLYMVNQNTLRTFEFLS